MRIADCTIPAQSVMEFWAKLACPIRQQAIKTPIDAMNFFIFLSS